MELESTPRYYSHSEPNDHTTARVLMRPLNENGVFIGRSRGRDISGHNLLFVGVPEDDAKQIENGDHSSIYLTVEETEEFRLHRLMKRSYIAERIADSLRHLRLHPLDSPMVSEYAAKSNGHGRQKSLTGQHS